MRKNRSKSSGWKTIRLSGCKLGRASRASQRQEACLVSRHQVLPPLSAPIVEEASLVGRTQVAACSAKTPVVACSERTQEEVCSVARKTPVGAACSERVLVVACSDSRKPPLGACSDSLKVQAVDFSANQPLVGACSAPNLSRAAGDSSANLP